MLPVKPNQVQRTPSKPGQSTQPERGASETKPTSLNGTEVDYESLRHYREANSGFAINKKRFTGSWPTANTENDNLFDSVTVSNCDITALFTSFCRRSRTDFVSAFLMKFTASALQKGCYITSGCNTTDAMVMLRLIINNADISQLNWNKMTDAIRGEKNQWIAIQKHVTNYRTKNTRSNLYERREINSRFLELGLGRAAVESAAEFVLRLKHSACSCCGGLFAARPACYKLAKLIEKDAGYKNKPSSRKPRQNNR